MSSTTVCDPAPPGQSSRAARAARWRRGQFPHIGARAGGASYSPRVAGEERNGLPVACTLGADEVEPRIESWRAVLSRDLVTSVRSPGRLVLAFRPTVDLDRLHSLVDAERQCCGFVDWRVDHGDGAVRVVVTGTEDGVAAVAAIARR